VQNSRGTLVPPGHQVRGIQTLPPEQGADATGLLFGLIGLGQDTLLLLAGKDAALGSGHDLGMGAVRADCDRPGLIVLCG
jgi:hypothetical protein